MRTHDVIYRRLRRHLDKQAVGFPATWSGADIRLLRRLFTPEEAELALHLSFKPAPLEQVAERAAPTTSPQRTAQLLDSMLLKGSIGWKEKGGISHWFLLPFVIGMYEGQDGNPSPEFLADSDAYTKKPLSFGRSFVSVKPSQMRTIPVSRSITAEHHVATYDQVRSIVRDAPGPFVVLPCICRKKKAMKNRPCARTSREETCLAFGHMAAMVLRRNHGREVTRDEVLAILGRNEEEGLVLQPANTQNPDFICSCCGCCCGMLSYQKLLPRPVDFWSTSHHAEVSAAACSRCGTCVSRCQVGAISLSGPAGSARIDPDRCIGCGLCVPTCPSQALQLRSNDAGTVPPLNDEALGDEIMANKKGTTGQFLVLMKAALKIRL